MRVKRDEKKTAAVMASILLCLSCLAGCGTAETAGQETETSAAAESGTAGEETGATAETAENEPEAEVSAEETEDESGEPESESADFVYLEEYQIQDDFDGGKEYALYAPKGGLNEDGLFYYQDHGVTFSAFVYKKSAEEDWLKCLDGKAGQTGEFWLEDLEYSDVNVGEAVKKGDDGYVILTAMGKDSLGTPYYEARLFYMSVRAADVGILLDMEVRECVQDEETAQLVDEVARYYDLDLSGFVVEDGTWAEQSAQDTADFLDIYEPEEGEPVLEKVEGYQHLGRLTLKLDDAGNVTHSVLAPMGRDTEAEEDEVSAMIHGVHVRIAGGYDDSGMSIQEILQEAADLEVELRNDPELHNRNAKASEVMPLEGQEKGAFCTIEYEMQNYGSEEYHKSAEIAWLIEVEENYFVAYEITLWSMDYDKNTNSLIKELEKAYGFDLSKWYAEE